MKTAVFRAFFPGMQVRILHKKGNPCTQTELQKYFHTGYTLVTLHTTPKNPNINVGHWRFKLVTVKPGWNVVLRAQASESAFAVIDPDELVLDIGYAIGTCNDQPVDLVTLTLYGLGNGMVRQIPLFIAHCKTSHTSQNK